MNQTVKLIFTLLLIVIFAIVIIDFFDIPRLKKDLITSTRVIESTDLMVYDIDQGSPAKNSGLEVGDIFVSVDGTPTNETIYLNQIQKSLQDGTVLIEIKRDDEVIEIPVVSDIKLDRVGIIGFQVTTLKRVPDNSFSIIKSHLIKTFFTKPQNFIEERTPKRRVYELIFLIILSIGLFLIWRNKGKSSSRED